MGATKNGSDTGNPALKYHRHGTWDMIDVPVAIRSVVDRNPSQSSRQRIVSSPSATQLLFKPKHPVRHPSISEVCSKFESLSRGNSNDFAKGPSKAPINKTREFNIQPNNLNLPANSSNVTGRTLDRLPLFKSGKKDEQLPTAVLKSVEFTGSAVQSDHLVSNSGEISRYSDLGEASLTPPVTDRTLSDLFRIQEDNDSSSSNSSSSQCSPSLPRSVNRSTISRVESNREPVPKGEAHVFDEAISSNLDQNRFSHRNSSSNQETVLMESNQSNDDKAVAHFSDLNLGLDSSGSSPSHQHRSLEDNASSLNHDVISIADPSELRAADATPPSLPSDRDTLSNQSRGYHSSKPFEISPRSHSSESTSEPSSLPAADTIALSSADPESASAVTIIDGDRFERGTVRDISAFFEMHPADDTSDSSSGSSRSRSISISRQSSTAHARNCSSLSESQIRDSTPSHTQMPELPDPDDIILDDAMQSLSLHFASDDDMVPYPVAIRNDEQEPMHKVRFDEESIAPQLEPRLDMFEYPLIKHGRRGHRRRIYLTVDMGAGIIRWGNGRRWMQIEHILQVRSGKETPVLKRRAAHDVDGRLCLSLITRYRSLDLECKTAEERKAVQLTIMNQIIGYLRHHNVRAGWIRPRLQPL